MTPAEKDYLRETHQKPVLSRNLNNGQLVAPADIAFFRTSTEGLPIREINRLQQSFNILKKSKSTGDFFLASDFGRAKIGAIIACRMKSSRLKEKALALIDGVPSIERCLSNCLRFPNTDEVILATSTLEEDSILSRHLLGNRVLFWAGDPEDLISRYLGACDAYDIDVIVRATGDCPSVSPEILECLLKSHFETGADFTEPIDFAVGTNSQIFNTEVLRRIHQRLGRAPYSEHMAFYVTNNPHLFKINRVKLPKELIRPYRLTLDYAEDLEMFNSLYAVLREDALPETTRQLFEILDQHPEIARINAHKQLVYKVDHALLKLLDENTRIPE